MLLHFIISICNNWGFRVFYVSCILFSASVVFPSFPRHISFARVRELFCLFLFCYIFLGVYFSSIVHYGSNSFWKIFSVSRLWFYIYPVLPWNFEFIYFTGAVYLFCVKVSRIHISRLNFLKYQ